MKQQKTGPVTIVTGASKGIGAAIVQELHDRGYRLALMSPSGASTALAKKLGHVGQDGSIEHSADIHKLVTHALETYGAVHNVVINTPRSMDILRSTGTDPAQYTSPTRQAVTYDPDFRPDIAGMPVAVWRRCFDLHVASVIEIASVVTPHLIRSGGGAILNISGIDASEPRQTYALGPIRLSLHGYSKLYADRYAADKIRMNCLALGFLENAMSKDPGFVQVIPAARYGSLAEAAKIAAFLLSDDASYITGQVITADGGLNRGVR